MKESSLIRAHPAGSIDSSDSFDIWNGPSAMRTAWLLSALGTPRGTILEAAEQTERSDQLNASRTEDC